MSDRPQSKLYHRDRCQALERAARKVLEAYEDDVPHRRGETGFEREAMSRLKEVLNDPYKDENSD